MSGEGGLVNRIVDAYFKFYLPSSNASRYEKTEPITRFFEELGKARQTRNIDDTTAKEIIAGQIFARIQRLREVERSRVFIKTYGEELNRAIMDFVNIMYDEVFKGICNGNFARARKFGKELRNACWFMIEMRLNEEWKKYKTSGEEKVVS
ncbi:MAG: hypothetical protein J7L07_04470 [Candidatus Odinarchaeota archaeon]|nr:hypothetical protein [Candidatus Odinarchaeota archaeon]